MAQMSLKIMLCTALALLAFAGNSILCKLALGNAAIDAASFTSIRLASGIAMLLLLLLATQRKVLISALKLESTASTGSWCAALLLFIYAIAFSYGYITLDTGIGALILFGAVQVTMILASVLTGNKLHYSEWAGLSIAFAGFIYLVLPSLSTPSLSGFILMTVSGIAWAGYTLMGRGSKNPLSDTCFNFLRTLPLLLILVASTVDHAQMTSEGVLLAVLSGALASGVGYTLWYIALGSLTAVQAGVLQLLVPVIATIGGVILLNESVTLRLLVSTALVLGGILLVIVGKHHFAKQVGA